MTVSAGGVTATLSASRVLTIDGLESGATIAAYSIPAGEVSVPDPETVRTEAEADLHIVFGGFAESEAPAERVVSRLRALDKIVLVLPGLRDRVEVLDDVLDDTDRVIDLRGVRAIDIGGVLAVPLAGAMDGHYRVDGACGYTQQDLAEIATGFEGDGVRWLFSTVAPAGSDEARGYLGVDVGEDLSALGQIAGGISAVPGLAAEGMVAPPLGRTVRDEQGGRFAGPLSLTLRASGFSRQNPEE